MRYVNGHPVDKTMPRREPGATLPSRPFTPASFCYAALKNAEAMFG